MRAFHLLPAEHALNNIALKRIRLSRYGDLNDPFELLAANFGKNKDVHIAVLELKKTFSETKGLVCFSREWGNPLLWSHYASKHRGIALGFDIDDSFAIPISYAEKPLSIRFQDNDPSRRKLDP